MPRRTKKHLSNGPDISRDLPTYSNSIRRAGSYLRALFEVDGDVLLCPADVHAIEELQYVAIKLASQVADITNKIR